MALMGDTQLFRMQPVPSQGGQQLRMSTSVCAGLLAYNSFQQMLSSTSRSRTVLRFPSLAHVEEKSLNCPTAVDHGFDGNTQLFRVQPVPSQGGQQLRMSTSVCAGLLACNSFQQMLSSTSRSRTVL